MATIERVAVVLFNLGGPNNLDAVEPFLFNLFKDPAIISVPNPFRWLIAKLIAHRRAPKARKIYAQMGGSSPILGETQAQAKALESLLTAQKHQIQWRVEIAMRHWHPFANEAVDRLEKFAAQRVILLPLYPQYSGTTTGSSLKNWDRATIARSFSKDHRLVCCYPDDKIFIAAHIDRIAAEITTTRRETERGQPLHILLSAHGLPKRVIDRGDPYQWQVELTNAAIAEGLKARGLVGPETEIVTCYQSRVGPLEWIGPATDAEIKRAGAAGAAVIVVPVAFVSEHAETLVELDIEYAALAYEYGVVRYSRVPALANDEEFIACLARLVMAALSDKDTSCPIYTGMASSNACSKAFPTCPVCGYDTA